MTIVADDLQTLHDYAEGVMTRAHHHSPNVSAIALAVLGGIIWRCQPGSVRIKQYDGGLANVLWWTSVSGRNYACAYNHNTDEIEVRDRVQSGPALHCFTNATTIQVIESTFARL